MSKISPLVHGAEKQSRLALHSLCCPTLPEEAEDIALAGSDKEVSMYSSRRRILHDAPHVTFAMQTAVGAGWGDGGSLVRV